MDSCDEELDPNDEDMDNCDDYMDGSDDYRDFDTEHNKLQLEDIRTFPRDLLFWLYDRLVPAERRVPITFWLDYDQDEQAIGLRSSLLLWVHSGFQDLPREFQLRATIATMSGKDSLVDIGTGAGKTLCMILPCLLAPDTMAVVFSPLKRLQAVQVLTFARYQIKAIAINEDTPNDPDLWKVCMR